VDLLQATKRELFKDLDKSLSLSYIHEENTFGQSEFNINVTRDNADTDD
jgi:hypothetical protein